MMVRLFLIFPALFVVFLLLAGCQQALTPPGPGAPAAPAPQETFTLKIQASWPTASSAFENLQMFAEKVEKMSGGRLKVDALPAGAVVGAFEVLDATHKGLLDGAHTCSYYWMGKHPAASLFTAAPGGPFAMDILDYFGWMYEGGGWELLQELYQDVLGLDIIAFPILPAGPQSLGWFKRPLKGVEDFKGLKYRVPGLPALVYKEMGMSVVTLPGAEIIPAGERGVIDAAEWAWPAEDIKMGFQDVWKYYYYPGAHEPNTTCELELNKKVWDRLPPDLQEIIKAATVDTFLRFWVRLLHSSAQTLQVMKERYGVNLVRTPEDILIETLKTWDRIAERESAKDPFFKKVYDSMRDYAATVVPARRFMSPYDTLYKYYWGEK